MMGEYQHERHDGIEFDYFVEEDLYTYSQIIAKENGEEVDKDVTTKKRFKYHGVTHKLINYQSIRSRPGTSMNYVFHV